MVDLNLTSSTNQGGQPLESLMKKLKASLSSNKLDAEVEAFMREQAAEIQLYEGDVALMDALAISRAAEIERLNLLSVTNILLAVVPGEDGAGHEVYAKSTDEVVNALTKLDEKLETAEDRILTLLAENKRLRKFLVELHNGGTVGWTGQSKIQATLRGEVT